MYKILCCECSLRLSIGNITKCFEFFNPVVNNSFTLFLLIFLRHNHSTKMYYFYFCDYVDQDINIFPEKGGDTSLRITILDEKKTDRQVMQTLVLLIPHFPSAIILTFFHEFQGDSTNHIMA